MVTRNGFYKQQQHAPMHNASADLLKVTLKTFEKIIFILKIMAIALFTGLLWHKKSLQPTAVKNDSKVDFIEVEDGNPAAL